MSIYVSLIDGLSVRPPADVCSEFEVSATSATGPVEAAPLPVVDCASIIIVYDGLCSLHDAACSSTGSRECAAGTVLFVPAGAELRFSVADAGSAKLFRAHVNLA